MMNPKNDSNPGWNMLARVHLIQPNHFLKSSQSRSHWDEMVCMSHLMHWDAHVFRTMNAKSQLACGVPFSHAESLRPPRILSRDNSTQRNFKSFHFSTHSTLRSSCDDLPFFSQPLLPLLPDTIRTDFGSLAHRYVCLLVLQRRIFQFAVQMNARQRAAVQRRLMNPLVKTFLISITEDVSNRAYSHNQNKTNKQK